MTALPTPLPPPPTLTAAELVKILDSPEWYDNHWMAALAGRSTAEKIAQSAGLVWLVDHGLASEWAPLAPVRTPSQDAKPVSLKIVGGQAVAPPAGKVASAGTCHHEGEAILAALAVRSAEWAGKVLARITPEEFFSPALRTLMAALAELHADGSFNLAVLLGHLAQTGALARAGGQANVEALASRTVSSEGWEAHAKLVRDGALKRAATDSLSSLQKGLLTGAITPAAAASRFSAIADRLSRHDSESQGWEAPDTNRSTAFPFPLEALPDGMRTFASAISSAIPCPVDYAAVFGLAAASVAVGRSMVLRIKPGWTEEANLWLLVVGSPSIAKSPVMTATLAPIFRRQREDLANHRLIREAISQERKNAKLSGRPSASDDPPPPHRLLVSDITRESLATKLEQNPRGLALFDDEMSGWVAGMGQYKGGSGNDLQFFLNLWGRGPIHVDRKGQEGGVPISVPSPYLTIGGGVQPQLLHGFLGGPDNGFPDRFLYSFPEMIRVRFQREGVDLAVRKSWHDAIDRLLGVELLPDGIGDPLPRVLSYTPAAFERFIEYFDGNAAETEAEDFPAELRGPWGKLRGYCARLALLCEMLEWSFRPGPYLAPPEAVGVRAVESAVLLCEYFGEHYRRVSAIASGVVRNEDAEAIAGWLSRRDGDNARFTLRQVRDCFRRRFHSNPEALSKALTFLESEKLIRKVPKGTTSKINQRTETYEVHPLLLSGSARSARSSDNQLS